MKKDGDALWSIQLRAQFRLHDDVFRPGEELTVHLPVPKNAMNMRDIEILATSHPIYKLADEKMHPRARSHSAANSRKTKPSGSNTNIFPM